MFPRFIGSGSGALYPPRERAAEYLLTTRLKQLREQAATRTEQAAPAPWTDWLPELAARPLDADMSGAVIA